MIASSPTQTVRWVTFARLEWSLFTYRSEWGFGPCVFTGETKGVNFAFGPWRLQVATAEPS